MMVLLLIAGIGFLLAGVLTIGFGIPVKEFSFGNTLILTGTVAACTGIIMLALWTVVRELRNIARRLGPGVLTEDEGLLVSPEQPAAENAGNAEPAAPSPQWHEDAGSRDRVRGDMPSAPEPVEAASAAKQRRNLLFHQGPIRPRGRARRSRTPGRNRSVPELPICCRGEAPERQRPLPSQVPTQPAQSARRQPHARRIRRQSRFSNQAWLMGWPIRCIPTARSRHKCPKA